MTSKLIEDKIYSENLKKLSHFIETKDLYGFVNHANGLISHKTLEEFIPSKKNDYLFSILDYVKKFQVFSSDIELVHLEGKLLFLLKDFDNARKSYEIILESRKDILSVYVDLSEIYVSRKDYGKAIDLLHKALKLAPKSVVPSYELGKVYLDLNEFENAKRYFKKAIEINPVFGWSYYQLAQTYIKSEEYSEAISVLEQVFELDLKGYDYMYKLCQKSIDEIEKRLDDSDYNSLSSLVAEIMELLHSDTYQITHYTSLSTACALILRKSRFRLSEGTFLNDTSEGKTLSDYLGINYEGLPSSTYSFKFVKKPYIGSFVNPYLDNDLTLWRMYGKEQNEEAKGCSLKIDGLKFIDQFRSTFSEGNEEWNDDIAKGFKLYRVAYLGKNFCKCGDTKIEKKLKVKLRELKELVKGITLNESIMERIGQISYLFKSKEYQYENEIRLVLSNPIFNEILNDNQVPTKVYIELPPIYSSLVKVVIGPKVQLAEEWAASFYYSLKKEGLFPDIEISTLPFK